MKCKGLCNNLAYNQCDSGKLMNSRKPSDQNNDNPYMYAGK